MSIGYSDIWVGGGVHQGWFGTVLPNVLLLWMPSRLSPLVVAAVSAAAAADDDDDGGGDDDDDDDDDNDNDDSTSYCKKNVKIIIINMKIYSSNY